MRIVAAPQARADLGDAYESIARDNRDAADRLLARLVEVIGLLATGAFTGREVVLRDGRRETCSRSSGSTIRLAVRSSGKRGAIELEGRDTLDEALVLGDEVLIGQTVLEKLDLFVDCERRRLVPNPAHPDRPVSKVK